MADRTDNSSDPNTLLQYHVRLPHPLTSRPPVVARPWFDDPAAAAKDPSSALDFSLRKSIVHTPGEVNKIRVLIPGIVVTHTDSPDLYVWSFNSSNPSQAPLTTLTGHNARADYALDTAAPDHLASGGSDAQVLIWQLPPAPNARLQPTVTLRGHTDTVEAVSFSSADHRLLASCGRDASLLLWDTRNPSHPTAAARAAHSGDVNSCDYGGQNPNHLVSAGADKVVRVWDIRHLSTATAPTPFYTLRAHHSEVNSVMWNRFVPNVIASGAEDGEVLVWRLGGTGGAQSGLGGAETTATSPELLFRHVGHSMTESKIIDLQWLPARADPWCMASLSELGQGGSTLQMWRMSDLIYRDGAELAQELGAHLDSKT